MVTDLSATTPDEVGWSLNGVVELDATAAGYGWFVDPTPQSNSEFRSGHSPAGMDLLTVVMHELGHQLGLLDVSNSAHPGDLMDVGLAPGVRRAYVSAYDLEMLGIDPSDTHHRRPRW